MDTFPRVTTTQGRSLINGGGIFPDLAVGDDTTTVVERELIRAVTEQEVPLGLRLAELGFEAASARRGGTQDPGLTDAEFDRFMTLLAEEGIAEGQLSDPGVSDNTCAGEVALAWLSAWTIWARKPTSAWSGTPSCPKPCVCYATSTSQARLFQAADAARVRRGQGAGGP